MTSHLIKAKYERLLKAPFFDWHRRHAGEAAYLQPDEEQGTTWQKPARPFTVIPMNDEAADIDFNNPLATQQLYELLQRLPNDIDAVSSKKSDLDDFTYIMT